MTTFDERLRALSWARDLLRDLAADESMRQDVRELAAWRLNSYPQPTEIENRLQDLQGFALLLSVRSIERTRALLDDLSAQGAAELTVRVQRIARHFPECREMSSAIRSPNDARAWAAMYLDRPPGRMGLLRLARPEPTSVASRCRRRQRRDALRRLRSALQRLQRDSSVPVMARSEAHRLLLAMPSNRQLGRRLQDMTIRDVNEGFQALQRACQLLEAIVEGTFPAGLRQQTAAQRLCLHLPCGEWFPINSIATAHRQAWVDALFLKQSYRIDKRTRRILGILAGALNVPDDFDDPLPDDVLSAFGCD